MSEEKKKMELPKAVKNYVGVVVFLFFGLAIFSAIKSGNGVNFGKLIGQLIGLAFVFYLFPLLLSVPAWFISKKSTKALSISFLLIFHVFLLGITVQTVTRIQERKEAQEVHQLIDSVKQDVLEVASSEDSEERAQVTNETLSKLKNFMSEKVQNTSGIEKQFYVINANFMKNFQEKQQKWLKIRSEFEGADILDFKSLRDPEKLNYRLELTKKYATEASFSAKLIETHLDNYRKALNPIIDSSIAKGAIKGAATTYNQSTIHSLPLQKEHSVYGQKLHDLLLVLSKTDTWQINPETEEVEFLEQKALDEYNKTLQEVIDVEEKVNHLHETYLGYLKKRV